MVKTLCYYVRTRAISTGAKHLAMDVSKINKPKATPEPPKIKVYLITSYRGNDLTIEKVYLKKENAEEYRDMYKESQSLESLSALVRSKLAADAASTLERIDSYALDGIKDESTREQILGSVAKRSALVFGWSEQGEQASVSINLLGSMPDRSIEVSVSSESETK